MLIFQRQLTTQKKEADELVYEIKQRKKKLEELNRHLETLIQKYDVTKIEEDIVKIEEKIERTDLETINEEFTTKCLEHMMDLHNQDIISIKMKIVRWKEIAKRHSLEDNELRKEEKKMTEKIDKLYSVLQRERNQKQHEDDNADTLFNQDVEDELSVFQDRITIGKIADYEKDLQRQKEQRSIEKAKLNEQRKEI